MLWTHIIAQLRYCAIQFLYTIQNAYKDMSKRLFCHCRTLLWSNICDILSFRNVKNLSNVCDIVVWYQNGCDFVYSLWYNISSFKQCKSYLYFAIALRFIDQPSVIFLASEMWNICQTFVILLCDIRIAVLLYIPCDIISLLLNNTNFT